MPIAEATVSPSCSRKRPLLDHDQNRWKSCSSTFQRVLGLAIKGLLLTAQRVFDVLAVLIHILYISDTWGAVVRNGHFWLMVFGVLASTFLSALTLSRHRSAFRKNRPYGWCVALVVSALQLAPLVEMVDKLGDGVCWGLREEETSPLQSVLSSSNHGRQAQEMKGSRYGENLMRGLRKLSIASLPLIFLSAIVHSAWLLEESQDGRCGQPCVTEVAALTIGIICLSMACADVVLYVWVDDAFVRHHKKLVQVHYFVEILTRLPLLCLLLNMESVGYIALLSLLACDLSASVLLLLMPTLLGWRRRMSCRHASSQVASAVIMSEILFFVNITMFDPREAFQVINMGFYIVKYLEAFIVCRILPWSIRSGEFRTTFQEVQLAAVVLNAFLVWVVVPKLRSMQDAAMSHARQDMPRLSELVPRDERDAHPSASRSQFFGLPETIALELSTVGSPQHVVRENRVESARLELLGDMLEGLCLTSEAQSDRNRPAVARSTVADVLWSLVLPWSGEYVESTSGGRIWLEILDPERGAILIRRERSSSDPDPSVGRWVESLGVVFQGTAIEAVLDVAEGRVLGTHTGEEIRFADANGTIWRRGIVEGSSGSSGSSSSSSSSSSGAREQESAAREVLRLVLTQVLLSLRWEPTFLGLGVVGAGKAKAGDLVAIDAARRPLLSFLLRYAIGTHDLSFISEIYWSLWCLSQDYLDPNRAAYDKARWVLINALEGNIEFWDSIRGVQLDQWAIQNKSGKSNPEADADKAFRDKALGLIAQQAALWQQTMQLAALGRETAGDTAEKTRAIRHRLHEMKQREDQATDPEERYLVYLEDSYLLERLEVDASLLAATQAASLVRQPRDFRSTPVDPSVPFLGVNIGHCEILKSNAAPLLLGCLQEPDSGCGLDLEAGDGMRRTVSETQVDRYMVKVGDDLRQDQLVLQMLHLMELVWQERLPKEENDMLRFVPYRVLAMTPSGGYIKFVPGAVSLSKALAQSNGDLMSWFSSNLPEHMTKDQVLNNLCGSAAAYCVATYVLGIGDRHLDNLQITPEGHFFHIDFGFIFGEDPKPFAPRLRLPQQIASVLMKEADHGTSGGTLLDRCFHLAGRAYIALRRSMTLWVSLLRVTGRAGGAGCACLRQDANAAVVVVTDRLRSDLGGYEEEKAATEFLLVLTESTEALYPVLTDKVHQLGLFWK
ncbi:Phosphatidylinositol 3-kinase VPS34 (PI3-kinase VPS34) (PI3K VPS34) (PtdIns-3-kinase VPS34) (Carboxypeptidase Y-deficient protein 15) (Vacuolar protein sorting-associated protein 34) (Vacuolar protein-targeting protein 29) [Durusdinium trenchii]|uniref:PI3K/PI4K catalytic domain-containing protein n=1 Tax=Durusdinium trenchii TaxID=1381693 RepID=A0ABP0MRY9_9DINO